MDRRSFLGWVLGSGASAGAALVGDKLLNVQPATKQDLERLESLKPDFFSLPHGICSQVLASARYMECPHDLVWESMTVRFDGLCEEIERLKRQLACRYF